MATLTVQSAATTGTALTFSNCAAGGDQYAITDSKTMLLLKNDHASADYNVTVDSVTACDQGSDHNLVVSVVHGTIKVIGPIAYGRFKDANGYVQITYSGVTTMTIAVVRLP